jgi:hypothetical protein
MRQPHLFIPTLGRLKRQATLTALADAGLRVTLVVQRHEARAYRKRWGRVATDILILPRRITTIGPTRQWILEQHTGQRIVMLDDDLRFSTRHHGSKFLTSTAFEIRQMIARLDRSLRTLAHASIGSRQGAHTQPLRAWNTRMQRVLGYNVDMVLDAGASFTRIEPLSDFDMTLQLLRLGFKNVVHYRWAQDELGGFNAPGGCSLWRTSKRLRKAQRKLVRLHPNFVRAYERTFTDGSARTELRVQWKRALQSYDGDT